MMSESAFSRYVRENIKSKLIWDFDFNMLRDSARYAAEVAGASPNHITISMGHSLNGSDDAYLFRHPEQVVDVSKAIYNYYML